MTLPSRQFLIQQAVLCAIQEHSSARWFLRMVDKANFIDSMLRNQPESFTATKMLQLVPTHFHRLLAEAQAREISEPRALL